MNNHGPNPKKFYDEVMPDKLGGNYEDARWRATQLQHAQYDMTARTIRWHVLHVLKSAANILEVGPGPGTWTKLLLSDNPSASYTLVDISATMLAQARSGLAQNANVTFVESDLLRFSANEKFDGFFSSRAIEYMPDKAAVSGKIASLLSSGAYGAVITKTPKDFFNSLRGRNVSDLHGGQVAPRELTNLLQKAGLEIIGVYAATATLPVIGSAFMNRILFGLMGRFRLFYPLTLLTESYCVVFKKP